MTVETLIKFLETLPKDTKVVQCDGGRDNSYREVDFQFIQTIDKNGKIEKSLKVKQEE